MPEDNLAQFKQILSKLPEDKRKRLYDRLHAMPPAQREAFIADYTRKYKSGQRKHPSSKNASQVKGQAPAKKAAPSNEHGQKAKLDPKKQASNKPDAKKAAPSKSAPVKADPKKHAPAQADPKKHAPSQQDPHKKNTPTQADHKKSAPAKADQHKKAAPSGKNPQKGSPAKKPSSLAVSSGRKVAPIKKKHEIEKQQPIDIEAVEEELANLKPIEEEAKEPPTTKEASLQSAAIGALIALVIIGLCYFVYLFNKPSMDKKFNQMFGMPAEETLASTPDSLGIEGSEPVRQFPTDTPTPIPPSPTPKPVTLKEDHPDLKGKVIVIDPGHQAVADTELENAIKGSSAEKDKATTGAVGVDSGAKEYEVTLTYAQVLKEYLEGCGAKVILTRDSNEANISNIERAKIATDNNATCFIRLHADSAPDSEISGVKVYVPSSGKYSKSAVKDGNRLAELVAKEIGSTSLGTVQSNMYTGLNYADSVKSYQLVIGYLSNSKDDAIITDSETPYKVAVAVSEFLR